VPANLVCIALYTSNLLHWRFRSRSSGSKAAIGPQESGHSFGVR
jgi:hypothetical protein